MKKKTPKWFETSYGPNPLAWEDAKHQCREVLIRWAKIGKPGTYGDLAQEITAIDWPEGAYTHHGGQIGWLLGQVSVQEWLEDRPLLSAMAILAGDSEPSYGFYSLCDQLGIQAGRNKEEKYDFWWREVVKCREYWADR